MKIDANSLKSVLEQESDFAFEMRVKKIVSACPHSEVQHGGSYIDPVEKKPRQYDIRFEHNCSARPCRVLLAIECKNIQPDSALIISCVPREKSEAYHFFTRVNRDSILPRSLSPMHLGYCAKDNRAYPVGAPVGKSIAQYIVTKGKLERVKKSDDGIYGKWSQSLSSSVDLCNQLNKLLRQNKPEVNSLVLPVVVVPDGSLWRAQYDSFGSLIGSPEQVQEVTYYSHYRVKYSYDLTVGGVTTEAKAYGYLSHVHFLTLSGIELFLSDFVERDEVLDKWFPANATFHQVI